jgi:GrpB-like predicted nucleotidyltransferase (UPF0157 family)
LARPHGEKSVTAAPERRPVVLVPHSIAWPQAAGEESARLAEALGDVLVEIHHVGSTAIPGILAKPIIDLVPVATGLAALDAAADQLRQLGYDWRGEFGIAGRRYCTRDDPKTGRRLTQLHCFADGHPEIERMVAFRDYLRAHPHIARAYEAEKERCRILHPDDTIAYAEAKNAWIHAHDEPAIGLLRARRASRSRAEGAEDGIAE